MGHASGQAADRFHLLSLADLLLDPPALGEILHIDCVVDHPSIGILDRGGIDEHGKDNAIAANPLWFPDLLPRSSNTGFHPAG